MKKTLFALAGMFAMVSADAQTVCWRDFMPEIHGTVRGKYEHQTATGGHRFQVRTARVSFTGNVTPIVSYKAEIDLCDEGEIKMLDAYARVAPLKFMLLSGRCVCRLRLTRTARLTCSISLTVRLSPSRWAACVMLALR